MLPRPMACTLKVVVCAVLGLPEPQLGQPENSVQGWTAETLEVSLGTTFAGSVGTIAPVSRVLHPNSQT